MQIIIELEFDQPPTETDVIEYLKELIADDCLSYSEVIR